LEGIAHAKQHSGHPTQTSSSIKTSRGGITFTDKDGNIIMDDDDDEDKNMTEDEPIPVVNNDNEHMEINKVNPRNSALTLITRNA